MLSVAAMTPTICPLHPETRTSRFWSCQGSPTAAWLATLCTGAGGPFCFFFFFNNSDTKHVMRKAHYDLLFSLRGEKQQVFLDWKSTPSKNWTWTWCSVSLLAGKSNKMCQKVKYWLLLIGNYGGVNITWSIHVAFTFIPHWHHIHISNDLLT